MQKLTAFDESVDMRFQIYNGLLLNLPFKDIQNASVLLPVFTNYCREQLEAGYSPLEIVDTFFKERVGTQSPDSLVEDLFRFLRLVERQIVLFDALEDSSYPKIHDIQGPGSLKDILNQVEREEDIEELKDFLEHYRVRIVLTAHPTQFYTDQVLGILFKLAEHLRHKDLIEIHKRLIQLGKTRFKKSKKPTPQDEAASLLGILESVMFQVIPEIHSRLVQEVHGTGINGLNLPGIVELGFWPGGDRDGNPFVNAQTTRNVAFMLKSTILKLYLQQLAGLKDRLTFEGVMEGIDKIEDKLTVTMNSLLSGNSSNYDEGTLYKSPVDFLDDLIEVRSILSSEHQGLFMEELDNMIFRVRCFGFHFAVMDIRQDSGIHEDVMCEILPQISTELGLKTSTDDYTELSEREKSTLLLQARKSLLQLSLNKRKELRERALECLDDPVQRDVLESIQAVMDIQKSNGKQAVHRYIISNSQAQSDVLEVCFFTLLAGFEGPFPPLDIVPLFETIDDLNNAPGVMTGLYTNDDYRAHLETRSSCQNIMLGFSDGTKDGGYVTANWEIFKAKENLTRVARDNGVEVVFFDGRGGPPARGGGNTHKFYRSLGKDIDSTRIQLTIQGQTISSSYGTVESATHNLEQLVSAGIENNIFPQNEEAGHDDHVKLMNEISKLARDYYLKLRAHPEFLSYLEEMTPLSYYGKTNIGSRPSKRKQENGLSLSSLRAIPFVGAWSQMKQNVPGYYGFGFAMSKIEEQGRLEELRDLYQKSLFFRTLVENSMQSLSKARFSATNYIGKDPVYSGFWHLLKEEADRTARLLKSVSGQDQLLATDPANRKSIGLRENLILPAVVIQQYALQKIRKDGKDLSEDYKNALEKLIIKSLAASVNASRNSV